MSIDVISLSLIEQFRGERKLGKVRNCLITAVMLQECRILASIVIDGQLNESTASVSVQSASVAYPLVFRQWPTVDG